VVAGRATGAITAAGSRNVAECWCQVPMPPQFVVRSQRSQGTDHHAPAAAEASMAEVSEPSLLLTLRWSKPDSNCWSPKHRTPGEAYPSCLFFDARLA
jgi:hypothetical protein